MKTKKRSKHVNVYISMRASGRRVEPVIKGMIARVLIEYGAEVTGLDKDSPLTAKLPDLRGLTVIMGSGKLAAKTVVMSK